MTEKIITFCLVSILAAGCGRMPPTEEIGGHLFGQPTEGTDRLVLTTETGSVTLKPSRWVTDKSLLACSNKRVALNGYFETAERSPGEDEGDRTFVVTRVIWMK